MSGKNHKILRKGAKKYRLPHRLMKKAFSNLDRREKEKFLNDARMIDYMP